MKKRKEKDQMIILISLIFWRSKKRSKGKVEEVKT